MIRRKLVASKNPGSRVLQGGQRLSFVFTLAGLSCLSWACSAEQTDQPDGGTPRSSASGSGGAPQAAAGTTGIVAGNPAGGATAGSGSTPVAGAASGGGGTPAGAGGAPVAGAGAPAGGSGGTPAGGAGAPALDGIAVLPMDGTGFTALWVSKPYAFGAWFTYKFHTGTTIVPDGAITTTGGKMCATLAGTATAKGGGAIGFKVCGAPKYPNAQGDSTFFPLACPAAGCIESEVSKPYSFCGGTIGGVNFTGSGIAKVAFLDGADKLIMEFDPPSPTAGFVAAPAGAGANVASIHFKSFSDGQFCVSQASLKLQ